MEKALNRDNEMLKALEAIHTENQKIQNCFQEIMLTRKSLEVDLDSVMNQLFAFLKEEEKLLTINAKHFVKIQEFEKEVNQVEERHKALTENIKKLDGEIESYKENSYAKINNFSKEAEKLSELFLSAVHNETVESECLKIFDEINNLKLEIVKKEDTLNEIKKDLEEFVFYGIQENPIELSVDLKEREILMSVMEEQFLIASQKLEELNNLKAEKQIEEFQWLQQREC